MLGLDQYFMPELSPLINFILFDEAQLTVR